MSWDPIWDEIFKKREWGKYPSEELIRFIARNYYKINPRIGVKILDLGCGYGAGTWYMAREGFDVSAIDGSKIAIDLLQQRLDNEKLMAKLFLGDITNLPFSDSEFDSVVDLNCLMCNDSKTAKTIISEVWRVLKEDGKFYSCTPQVGSWGDGIGTYLERNTYRDSPDGPFANMGIVRFSDEQEIMELYGKFSSLQIDFNHRSVNNQQHVIKFWSISGEK